VQKPFTYALLLAAALGLAACDKKEEEKTQVPPAPATETQPSTPAPETTMPQPSTPAPAAPVTPAEEQPAENQ
jgi:PBP1b-binding outer membrane lipoprotein LpoB